MLDINPLTQSVKNIFENKLAEDDLKIEFSLSRKFYYLLIRPLISVKMRQRLQHNYNSQILYNKDFIYEDIVNMITDSTEFHSISDQLYPFNKRFTVVLTHDVETETGFNFIPKVLELEEKYGFKSSWNIVPYKYKIDKGIINTINDSGFEIGLHGYNHDGKLYYSEKIFNERVPYINKAIKEYGAVGFRSPMVHRNLLWLQKLDIEYDASCFDYDPFQPFPGGIGSIWPFVAGKFVELPYTLPQDHTMFYVLNQKDITIWKNKADWIAKNKGVILTLTHPDYLLEKKHFEMYEDLLRYLKSLENGWYCLPRDLSRHWKDITNQMNTMEEIY